MTWKQVTTELAGMAITYLIVIVIFAVIYMIVGKKNFSTLKDKRKPTFLDFLYYASTTTSSVGYGDIYPTSNLAKIIVMFNQFVAIGAIYLIPSHLAELAAKVQ